MGNSSKPRLTEKSYRKDYLNDEISLDEIYEQGKKEFVTTEEEPLLMLLMF